MGTITPMLDTLLPQVAGRAGDVARVAARSANGPLTALRPIGGEMPSNARSGTPYSGGESLPRVGAAAAGTRASPSAVDLSQGGAPSGVRSSAASLASAQLHLSRGAAALTRLLGGLEGARSAPATRDAGPLADGPPRISTLTAALAQQVTTSGLFYESHLARWVRGRYPLARLATEPQARLAAASATARRAQGHRRDLRAGGASDPDGGPSAVDPRLAAVVQRQAELLAGGVFAWSGQAWPGVPMHWQIQQGAARDPDTAIDESPTHTASLSLQLDGMGRFEARLSVDERGVHIAAWAEHEIARSAMAGDLEGLRNRLRTAGCGESSVRMVTEPDA